MMNSRTKKKKGNYCDICQKVIAGTNYKFKSHLYTHNVVEPRISCNFCEKKFFRSDRFKIHVETHLGKSKIRAKKQYICDYCDRSFVEKRNLILHLKIHDETFSLNSNEYKCLACGTSYCEQRLLNYHIRKMHYNLLCEKNMKHEMKELNETWLECVNKTDICVEMTKINQNAVCIKKIGAIKGVKNTKKPIDNERVKFKQYMNSVFALKDNTQYSKATCDYCNKEMLKKSLLQHIRARHLKLRNFKCVECNCSFQRHYQLINHVCGQVKMSRMKLKRL